MDLEPVRAGYEQAIPFAVHLGLKVTELEAGRAVVVLPDDQELRNHVGSQHAGALFTAGEAASGGAFVGAFAERMGDITPLAESGQIAYKKIARGPITATGTFSSDVDELFAELDEDGRVRFPVDVSLTDGDGQVVAEMTVQWYVRRKES